MPGTRQRTGSRLHWPIRVQRLRPLHDSLYQRMEVLGMRCLPKKVVGTLVREGIAWRRSGRTPARRSHSSSIQGLVSPQMLACGPWYADDERNLSRLSLGHNGP